MDRSSSASASPEIPGDHELENASGGFLPAVAGTLGIADRVQSIGDNVLGTDMGAKTSRAFSDLRHGNIGGFIKNGIQASPAGNLIAKLFK